MANSFFQFKQFTIHQDRCAMKVTTDGCLFGAWIAREILTTHPVPQNMLDIGTGTGLLTLMVAQKHSPLIIDAVEIDKQAYLQALDNIRKSEFPNKIYLANEDILAFSTERKYDLITCNPPFYEKEIRSDSAQKNIAHHGDGLQLEELLRWIKGRLTANSNFYLLLPFKRNKEIELLFKKSQLHIKKKVLVRQSVNHDHFRIMLSGALYNDSPLIETEMAIKDEKGNYTTEFSKLLKDYYLHL
ncbi:MAG TPA: methyltransferase [Chitinophagaceae bacterium]